MIFQRYAPFDLQSGSVTENDLGVVGYVGNSFVVTVVFHDIRAGEEEVGSFVIAPFNDSIFARMNDLGLIGQVVIHPLMVDIVVIAFGQRAR